MTLTYVPIQQTFGLDSVWEPLYQLTVHPEPFERELFQCPAVRRLKHLHHYGAGALFSPVTHSRFEHTVGVWALLRHFFPGQREWHAAAILHDIGHLPFSHTIEQALGISHHQMTEEAIAEPPVSEILTRHGLSPQRIIELLNSDSPLTHRSDWLGIDHLDSFLRDTYMAGRYKLPPSEIVHRIRFHGIYMDTDEETALHLLNAVINDNLMFLHPPFLAMDDLLSRAVHLFCYEQPGMQLAIARMTDAELLSLLQSAADACPELNGTLHVLLREPHKIESCGETDPGARKVGIRKLYLKQPLVGGLPLSSINPAAQEALGKLESLPRACYYRLRP
ncbi:HD domain-containing protein [Paenibacillus sp. 32352]|uniref:HD domain-containing protein n=1 Tax=Paenibacillus sp. 32352 TaxID=1969111 RepID=UPI0015C47FD8|nr:HD domain-containing protein [Paenibacillus sp. 32352]